MQFYPELSSLFKHSASASARVFSLFHTAHLSARCPHLRVLSERPHPRFATLSRLAASSHRPCRVCATPSAVLHSFRLNGVSLYDALGWQAVTERVLALPVSERLFSTYHSLLNSTRRLECLDPLFEELSAALTARAEAARSSHMALESWVQRHALCQASVVPVIDGFAPHAVASALDVYAHAAPWELSVLPARLVDHFESLLKVPSGVTVLHSSLHPSSVLAVAVTPGISVVKGDLSALAECVEASAGLSCVFLAHLTSHLAPDPSVVSSIAELLDGSISLPLRLELAVVLSQEKPMLSL